MVVDALLRFARDFAQCTEIVVAFLISNRWICDSTYAQRRIRDWIRLTIRRQMPHSHDFEVSWCLLLAGVLRIKIESSDFDSFDDQPSSVVLALLGMLRERKLLEPSLEKWGWRSRLAKSGVHGADWLPLYEAVLRGWTGDQKLIRAVNSDPLLKKLLLAKITFLENQILDATEINIDRRVFTKGSNRRKRRRGWKRRHGQSLSIRDFFEDLDEDQYS